MLVLERKKDESIFIGKDIEVIVLSVGDKKVKLGIKCPLDLKIMRNELIKKGE